MKIVHVIDYFQPQLGYQEAFLAKEHAKAGHDVHVVTSDRYAPHPHYEETWQPVLGPRLTNVGVSRYEGFTIHRLPCRFEKSYRLWLNGLEKHILNLEPELVIVHGMGSLTALRVLRIADKIKLRGKLIFDSHSNDVNSNHPFRQFFYRSFRYFGMSRQFVRKADGIVAIDDNSMKFLVKEYGIPKDRIEIIPMGADPDIFYKDIDARRQLRQELGIDDSVVLIYVGKIQPRKGVHLFIEAAIALMNERLPISAMIVGSGASDYIAEMKLRISEVKLDDNFYWVDLTPNSELYRYYSAADISVWPLEVSIGTLEAQSCGLPLVVADVPILQDRVRHQNGLTYKSPDVQDLVDKLRVLINNPNLCHQMGNVGRLVVKEKYSWRVIARQFVELV